MQNNFWFKTADGVNHSIDDNTGDSNCGKIKGATEQHRDLYEDGAPDCFICREKSDVTPP